jgi:RIO kinase 1
MVDPLAPLLADGVIDDVVARLKSGKEADLWIVRHRGEAIAAKVYKARESRSFRNDAVYREGRQVRDTRTQRAMARGSRFGQAASEEAWKSKEADALHALHAAGVRVPTPVMFYEGILLMELVLGPDDHPAPRLIDAHLTREGAAALYADLRGQVVRMLACDLIHGDLSPYNVLLGRDGPVVIDFPQVIGAAHNSQAERFFERDLENLRRFFAALDPALHAAAGDAREIWRAYVRRELTPDFVPSGKAPEAPRGGAGQGKGQAQGARGEHRRDDRRERRPGGSHGEERRREHGGRDAAAPRAEREHRPRPELGRREGGHEPRGRGGPPPPAAGRGPPRRDRGPRMPEVVRVARPPLGPPSPAARTAHPSAPAPGPAPRSHVPRPPHAGGEAEPPRAAHPQQQRPQQQPPRVQQQRAPQQREPHPQQGSRPAEPGAETPARRRRRRRRGPRSG